MISYNVTRAKINAHQELDKKITIVQLIRMKWATDQWLMTIGNLMDNKTVSKGRAKVWYKRAKEWAENCQTDINSRGLFKEVQDIMCDVSLKMATDLKRMLFLYEQAYCRLFQKNDVPNAQIIAQMTVADEMAHTCSVMNAQEIQALHDTNNQIDYMKLLGGRMVFEIPDTDDFDVRPPATAAGGWLRAIKQMQNEILHNFGIKDVVCSNTDAEIERSVAICGKSIVDYLSNPQYLDAIFDDAICENVEDKAAMNKAIDAHNEQEVRKEQRRADNKRHRTNARLEKIGLGVSDEELDLLNEVFNFDEKKAYKFLEESVRTARSQGETAQKCLRTAIQVARDIKAGKKNPYELTPANRFLDWEIDKLGFSWRVKKVMAENGVKTLREMLQLGSERMYAMNGFGPACMRNVKATFVRMGILVKDERTGEWHANKFEKRAPSVTNLNMIQTYK